MGTWICHIRVAELLLDKIPGLDMQSFVIGNLSPDSGYPNEDWTVFDPPKEVTHFMLKDETEANIRDLYFYRAYLESIRPHGGLAAYSFRLGYFFHLLCDNLWSKLIGRTTLAEHASLIQERGIPSLIELAKSDWYGLDHLYVRSHPDSAFWRIFMAATNPPSSLDFIPLHALHHQLNYIREYYTRPDPERLLDRPFPYLNENTMARFVQDCAIITMEIYQRLQVDPVPEIRESCLELLEADRYAPYPPPLGDLTN